MEITIKKTAEFEKALVIATSLPEFFNQQGLDEIQMHLPEQKVYGAYDDEDLVGCVSYKKVNDKTIELAYIFILESYQGKGVGTKLVQSSLSIEKKGFALCQVKTLAETVEDAGYAQTRKFYEKLGFDPIEIIDPYPTWGLGNPCQIYVKCLK